jgi:DNA sulfur modification protein DndE
LTTLEEVLSDRHFRGSRDGDVILSRLRRDFQLTEKWQVARLAIAASLADPEPPAGVSSRDGTEIRGTTLFKRDGTGPAVAALIVSHAQMPLEPQEIATQIEAHWDRGLQILNARVEKALANGHDVDSVLVAMADEAALGSQARIADAADNEKLDQQIVGQAAAKRLVGPLLRDALAGDPVRLEATLLFTGPASTGKTMFSQTIATSLGLPLVDTNGSVTKNIGELLARIESACAESGSRKTKVGTRGGLDVNRYPPAVVFIDECHAMSRAAQTELLTATEPAQREAKTKREIADLSQVTFLLATTDSTKLLEPLRTRTREVILEPYSRLEVSEIIRRSHPSWPNTVCQRLAVAGRLIPRQALIFAEDFDRYLRQEHPEERCNEQLALKFMGSRGMDELGLVARDYRYLELLPSDGSSRGLQMLASQLRLEEAEVEDGVEPFLLQLRLVERESKGRRITSRGLDILDAHED